MQHHCYIRGGWTRSRALAELAQLIDKDFLCKLLAGVARSLETGGGDSLATLNIKLSLTNPIPSILTSYQCMWTVY